MKRALIMAGGTGGHIFPGLALIQAMLADGWSVAWMGAPNSMEERITRQHDIPFLAVNFQGVRGKGLLRLLSFPWQLLLAMWQVWQHLKGLRPDVVVGMGGYITVPGGLVAWLQRLPLVLHEQNAIAGSANRLLQRLASHVLTTFPNVLPNGQWIGNPIRGELLALPAPAIRYQARSGPLQLLVLGGSQGATALNKLLPQVLQALPSHTVLHITHQTGAKHLEATQALYAQSNKPVGCQVHCTEFVNDMAACLQDTDLMICRAGASTVTEIAAVGVAAIFIPLPTAIDNHQQANAEFLSKQNAALLQPQGSIQPAELAALIAQQSREDLQQLAQNAWALGKREATQMLLAACTSVLPLRPLRANKGAV